MEAFELTSADDAGDDPRVPDAARDRAKAALRKLQALPQSERLIRQERARLVARHGHRIRAEYAALEVRGEQLGLISPLEVGHGREDQ